MPKLKPEEIKQRRQEIIEAARSCFLRRGFHQTTTDEICQEAAITPGGLYHYFGSKEEIISAVIEDAARSVIDMLRARTEIPDVRSAFREVGSFFVESLLDPNVENVARLDIETWAEALRNEDLAEINRKAWGLRRRWLEDLITRARNEGIYSEQVNPKAMADLLMALFIGLRTARVLWDDDFDLDGAISSLFLMHTGSVLKTQLEVPPGVKLAGRSETT